MNKTTREEKYTTEKRVVYQTVKKKKVKVKIPMVILALLVVYLIYYGIASFLSMHITNIYISGNSYYSDWEIIKMAKLDNYPSFTKYSTFKIADNLEKNDLIINAKVKRRYFTRIYIEVEENKPLFIDSTTKKVVLSDGTRYDGDFDLPTLVNSMDEKLYNKLIKKMKAVDDNVLRKISEIKYDPDDVDDERFLLTMNDGNYVYLTIIKFSMINDYNDIVATLDNKKGILYLNSGGYFKIMEN